MNLRLALSPFLVGIGAVASRVPTASSHYDNNDNDDDASSSILPSASDVYYMNQSIILDKPSKNHADNNMQEVPIIESEQLNSSQMRATNHKKRLQFLQSPAVLRNQPSSNTATTASNSGTNKVDIDSGHLRYHRHSVSKNYDFSPNGREFHAGIDTVDTTGIRVVERNLDAFNEYCNALCEGKSRPIINKNGADFAQMIRDCFGRPLSDGGGEYYYDNYDFGGTGSDEYYYYNDRRRTLTERSDCPEYIDYSSVPIGCWETSRVTDMAYAFKNQTLNEPINCWNVSRVAEMEGLFYDAINFNQPLRDWNVSRVRMMSVMFYNAGSFNQPIDQWDVSNVSDMSFMFTIAYDFNQCISTWADKTSAQVDTYDMFEDATSCPNDVKSPDSNQGPWCQGPDEGCYVGKPLTKQPLFSPTRSPIDLPTKSPTAIPTESPTESTTTSPSVSLTASPSNEPSAVITMAPSGEPSSKSSSPSSLSIDESSKAPSESEAPSESNAPSGFPSEKPSRAPASARVENDSVTDAGTTEDQIQNGMQVDIYNSVNGQQSSRNLREGRVLNEGTCTVVVDATIHTCGPDVEDRTKVCFSVITVIQEPQPDQGNADACDVNAGANLTGKRLRRNEILAAGDVDAGSVRIVLATEQPSSQPSQVPSNAPTTEFNCIDNEAFRVRVADSNRIRMRTVQGCRLVKQQPARCSSGNKAKLFRKQCPSSCNLPVCTCIDSRRVKFKVGRKRFTKECRKIGRKFCDKSDKVKMYCPKRCRVYCHNQSSEE